MAKPALGPSIGRVLTLFLPERLETPLLKAATALVLARGYSSVRLAHAEALALINHLALAERSITQGEAEVLRTYFNDSAALRDTSQPAEKGVLPMAHLEYEDPAHDADMRALRLEQLRADISPEEAEQESGWPALATDDEGEEWADLQEGF